MNADGTGVTTLVDLLSDAHPDWDPLDEFIAFVDAPGAFSDDELLFYRLADGAILWLSVDADGNFSDPAWSPDGNSIAYIHDRTGDREIYVMNADGTAQSNLTDDPARDLFPTWSPE